MFWSAAVLMAAMGQGQQAPVANAQIELPTVGVFSVNTTVAVPTNSAFWLGGIGSGAMTGNSNGGNRNGANGVAAGGISTEATVIDIHDIDANIGLRVADRMRQGGRTSDAIAELQRVVEESENQAAKREATARLEEYRAVGLTKYAEARRQAEGLPPAQASAAIDAVLDEYGGLIMTPERRNHQRDLANHPEVAQARHGGSTDEYIRKGQEAEARGKPHLAKSYYRMAAKHSTTQGGAEAAEHLARLDKAAPAVVGEPAVHSGDVAMGSPEQNIRMARLYRSASPEKAREYYRKALLAIPAGSPVFAQLAKEAGTLNSSATP